MTREGEGVWRLGLSVGITRGVACKVVWKRKAGDKRGPYVRKITRDG